MHSYFENISMPYTTQILKEENKRKHSLPKLWQLKKHQIEMCALRFLKINFELNLEKQYSLTQDETK